MTAHRGYVTDYIGGTGLAASTALFVTWTQLAPAPHCANFSGYEGQLVGNWIDPPSRSLTCKDEAKAEAEACRDAGARCRAAAHGTALLACNEAEKSCKIDARERERACEQTAAQALANLARLPPLPSEIQPVTVSRPLGVVPLGPTPTGGAIGAPCSTDASCAATPGAVCVQTICACPGNLALCGLTVGCVDLASDPDHCGGCNVACAAGVCHDGLCIP